MSKVTVIGAGNVGATCVNSLAIREIAGEIVLLDIKEGLAEGKVMDIYQTSSLMNFDTKIIGVTNDYSKTVGSDVIIITSGMPRKPGMSREELIGVNAGIVKDVVANVLKFSPDAILIIVSNPMDTMTYLASQSSGLPYNRIFGLGGVLDSARLRYYLAQTLGANINDIDGMVIGGHGDTTMIPLISKASYKGVPVTDLLDEKTLNEVVAATMTGGATLTKLIGTSAWYAPGAAASLIVKSIINDEKKVFPSCVHLDGQYGEKDLYIGVPAVIGRNGVEKILEVKLTDAEKEAFAKSAQMVRKTNSVLYELGAL